MVHSEQPQLKRQRVPKKAIYPKRPTKAIVNFHAKIDKLEDIEAKTTRAKVMKDILVEMFKQKQVTSFVAIQNMMKALNSTRKGSDVSFDKQLNKYYFNRKETKPELKRRLKQEEQLKVQKKEIKKAKRYLQKRQQKRYLVDIKILGNQEKPGQKKHGEKMLQQLGNNCP